MEELAAVRREAKPTNVLLVLDAMTGQEAVNVAQAFQERIDFDGVVLTKLDGDARGGAALSVKAITGKPIKLASVGEKLDALEWFHPDRMAGRILGMGDVLTLIERAESAVEDDDKEELERRMLKGEFSFDDFLKSYKMLRRMGPLQGVLKLIPGLGKQLEGLDQVDDKPARPGGGDHPLDDAARAARPARDRRLAPQANRGRQRHHGRAGEPADRGPEADGEDDEDRWDPAKCPPSRAQRLPCRAESRARARHASRPVSERRKRRGNRMAVRLRLTRIGSKKNPIYRVVAADSHSPRDGKFIEIVGRYNPQHEPSLIEFDEEKVRGWLQKGALPTEPVARLLKAKGIK